MRHPGLRVVRAVLATSVYWLLGCSNPATPTSPTPPESPRPVTAPPSGSVQYSVATLPELDPSKPSYAYDINDGGTGVGSSREDIATQNGCCISAERAVRWDGAGIAALPVGGFHMFPSDTTRRYVHSVAYGVAPNGTIVGTLHEGSHGTGAFRLTAGGVLDTLRGFDMQGLSPWGTWAVAVNKAGLAAGWSVKPHYGGSEQHAVKWLPNGIMVDLHPSWAATSAATDVNEAGSVSGWARSTHLGTLPVVWAPDGQLQVSSGALFPDAVAMGLNDLAQVVGGDLRYPSADPGGDVLGLFGTATLWPQLVVGGGLTLFPCGSTARGELPGSAAFEISNLGRITGTCRLSLGASFVNRAWTARFVDGALGSYELLPSRFSMTWARAVNACGTVVGYGFDISGGGPDPLIWTRINTAGPSGAPVCDR